MTVIYAILIFCVLIFVHELGHFMAAKACGVKVNEFALGMGPAIIKKQKGETLYSLRLLPIGGFCAMEGEDEESDDARALNNKVWWQKAVIIAAGAFMNLIFAVLIMTLLAFASGTPTNTLKAVEPGSPAELAGISAGDTITEIDGREVISWTDVYTFIGESTGEEISFKLVSEDGITKTVTSGFEINETGRRIVGVTPEFERSIFDAAGKGVKSTWMLTVSMVDVFKQLFTGEVPVSELSGPVGIVAVVNDTAPLGFIYIAFLMAVISLNLAIVNMLPLPALDGGRLFFILIRAIAGKRITDDMEGKVHFIGIMLLFTLMIYVTWNDIMKFIIPLFK